MLCCCDVALMLDIDKGKRFFCRKMVPIYSSVQRAGSTTWARVLQTSDWPVACLRKDQTVLLAVGDCRERGARGEAEEFASSEAPTSITRLTENINKAVMANDCKTRAVRG